MSWKPTVFNPLSFESISNSIARELAQVPTCPLDGLPSFEGLGIYALYYTGDFPAYAPMSEANQRKLGSWPIYVGKAEASTRKGEILKTPDDYSGNALFKRLSNHARSVALAENLNVADFHVRALVLAYVWVPMAEAAAISMYRPLWNTLIDGFGNHDPGKGRYNQMRSRWDTLHPGRAWADKLQPNAFTAEQIANEALSWQRGQA